ncbi:hypothetical protein [Rhodovulum adriaticum]|uniref:Methyltransferase FkbM-like protein n=1 Tax=Rhodovulum adriaticum TaxID=35804 RepID=A0A4R2NWG5_RHOAD|nr:hypothetical protein [Rhodovulum adriaticum]MBK1636321.1 hypothetical protein [Rhodovulum adriaticum]TCP26322.1 hypothetical protein EV656_102287 [Rhodovulum adriaticum]
MTDTAPKARYIADFLRPAAIATPLIRVGAFGDGGYLLPNDLNGIAACYSPGVSRQSTFELDLAKHGIPSFMADGSIDGPAIDIPGSTFTRRFVGPEDTPDRMSIATWVAQTDPAPGADLLLQMDIEGDEYTTLAAVPDDLLDRFRIIVLELHRLPSILSKDISFQRARRAIDKLRSRFQAVHLHTNNASGTVELDGTQIPRVVEVTLLRKDRVTVTGPVTTLPHPLDRRHRLHQPDIPVPPAWLGAADQSAPGASS